MSITLVEPPSKRSTGRRPRLSDEDIQDLANGLKAAFEALKDGKDPLWLSDKEPVLTKSAAYQRAQSARDLVFEALGDEYKIEDIKTAVEPIEVADLNKPQIESLKKSQDSIQDLTKEKVTYRQKDKSGVEVTMTSTEVYLWKIGPRPAGEQPRRPRKAKQG